jgi:hypothetical protein
MDKIFINLDKVIQEHASNSTLRVVRHFSISQNPNAQPRALFVWRRVPRQSRMPAREKCHQRPRFLNEEISKHRMRQRDALNNRHLRKLKFGIVLTKTWGQRRGIITTATCALVPASDRITGPQSRSTSHPKGQKTNGDREQLLHSTRKLIHPAKNTSPRRGF